MPVSTLITTAGSANANAYCDVAFADQYQLDRPAVGTTWTLANPDMKSAALLWATRLMDSLWNWTGFPTDAHQALLWPRQGMLKRNGWEYVDMHTIPVELQNATAEYARQLLVSDLAGNSQIETQGITSLKVGPVAFTFKEGVTAKPVPDTVFNLIPPSWGYPRSRNSGVRELLRA
jgi:hypothetical protein